MNDKGNTPYLVEELGFEFAQEEAFYWQNLGKLLRLFGLCYAMDGGYKE